MSEIEVSTGLISSENPSVQFVDGSLFLCLHILFSPYVSVSKFFSSYKDIGNIILGHLMTSS